MHKGWSPLIGPETQSLLKNKLVDDEACQAVAREALSILENCPGPANDIPSITGLALGYVQSGKTLSFTTLATLARDNDFPIVIVLGGTTKPLFRQSNKRLMDDLRYESRHDRKWSIIENPSIKDRQMIESDINNWKNPKTPAYLKRTALLTVMKNASRIRSLNVLLRALALNDTPVLIIDDEADQAGLNTLVRQEDVSATHKAIVEMKAAAGRFGYVEYTATPQALLLISIIDTMSPGFARILNPGSAYVGGKEYFVRDRRMLKNIPANELPTPVNNLVEPPNSFLDALRLFFVGVSAGLILDQAAGNRSMMIHPSRLRDIHGDYAKWVKATRKTWQDTLEADESDPDRVELLEEFRPAYNDLATTVSDIPTFEEIATYLPFAMSQTEIKELNTRAGQMPEVNWKNHYAYILIGGQAIDRGFTVEGLTVTYMPRSLGQHNADTVQQRARFYGYKRKIFGYCRVFLEREVEQAYTLYVNHEEDVRNRLIEWGDNPLSQWKRRFYLDPMFEPTRRNVLSLPIIRGAIDKDWFSPRYPYIDEGVTNNNRQLVSAVFAELGEPDAILEGQAMFSGVRLTQVFEKLLMNFAHADPRDDERFNTYLLQIRLACERDGNELCDIVLMRAEKNAFRTAGESGIKQLFSGRRPKTGPATYVGDREVYSKKRATIQYYSIDVKQESGEVISAAVPILAIKLPTSMEPGLEQPNNP